MVQEVAPLLTSVALPASQSEQTERDTAPETIENFPAGQLLHALAVINPGVAEYLPAGQFSQNSGDVNEVVAENLPAGQFSHVVAPLTSEYLPLEQAVQLAALMKLEYVPLTQVEHAPALTLYVPALHVTGTTQLDPMDAVPAGQS